jgi:hypothetical protein
MDDGPNHPSMFAKAFVATDYWQGYWAFSPSLKGVSPELHQMTALQA